MKVVSRIILIVVFLIIALAITFFIVDYNRVQKQEKPIFCVLESAANDGGTKIYIGLGYKVIDFHTKAGFDDIKIGTWFMDYDDFEEVIKAYEKKHEEDALKNMKIIKVKGKLYVNNGEESTITGRCGNMDGQINSNVTQDEIPTQDDQANFKGIYEYQYGADDTIEVKINEKWYVFRQKDI